MKMLSASLLASVFLAGCAKPASSPSTASLSPIAGPASPVPIYNFPKDHIAGHDVWIHAVGIDETTISENYISFYRSADDFLKTCKSSERSPECHLFIETDKHFAAQPDESSILVMSPNEGVSTREKVLGAFATAIREARAPEQIILSLEDHGSPAEDLSGHSCIWLSDGKSICDTDLKPIIDQAQNGVKIFINASGCYSGAFAKLATNSVCTMTASDSQHVSHSDQPSLWKLISDVKAHALREIQSPSVYGDKARFSSVYIARSLCQGSRDAQADKDAFSAFTAFSFIERYQEDTDLRILSAGAPLSPAIKILTDKLKAEQCADLKLPDIGCEIRNRVLASDQGFAFAALRLDRVMAEMASTNVALEDFSDQNLKGVDHNVVVALESLLRYDASLNDYGQWPQLPEIKRRFAALKPLYSKLIREQKSEKAKVPKILKDLKSQSTYEDWIDMSACLSPDAADSYDDDVGNKNEDYWNKIARASKQLTYSESDYRAAKTCESAIRF